jgi:HK97 family phage prohead protease
VDADPADTTAGRDARELVRRGDLYSMSFGFTVAKDAWSKRADGSHLRTLLKADRLYDVSIVTFPAYLGTDVSMRTLFGDIPNPPDFRRATARGQLIAMRVKARKGM